MPNCSTIDLSEIRQSSKITSWIWSIMYGVVTVLGRPWRGASQVEKSPSLNWATQFFTVAYDGACSPNVFIRMEWISFGALPYKGKKNLMTARVSMLKSRAWPDMLPFSLCSKKSLATRHMNGPLFPTTLRRREVGRAKDLSAPPHICLFSCLMKGTQYESYCKIFCIILILSFTEVEVFRNSITNLCLCVERKVNKRPPMNMTSVLPTPFVRWCW